MLFVSAHSLWLAFKCCQKRLNLRDKTLPDNLFTLGGQADSLYEYLPKMHALLGGREPRYAALYGTAMDTALKNLAFRPMVPDAGNTSRSILFTGEVSLENGTNTLIPSYQHLSCFVGGMFGLAGKLLQLPYHVSVGEQITEGCVWAYNGTPTGIMPEVFSLIPCPEVDDSCQWNEIRWQREGADERFAKGYASVKDSRYILRPEAIESVFVSYRICCCLGRLATVSRDSPGSCGQLARPAGQSTQSVSKVGLIDLSGSGAEQPTTGHLTHGRDCWIDLFLCFFFVLLFQYNTTVLVGASTLRTWCL
ncbi:Glycoside hydrolase [Rhypophila decipiens]